MASCTYNPGIDNYNPYAVLTVTESSYDVNKNTSVVSWNLKLYRPNAISSSAAKNYSVVIDGATVASGSTTIGGSGTKTIASGTKTITHNSDGKKTISFSFALDFEITWSGTYVGTGKASGSLALTNIPRVSTFAVSKTSADMNTAVTFTITRASTAFTHKLTLTWGGVTSTIASNVATSHSWTIPLSLANDLPNSTSSGCIITCITYNGSTEIGRKTLAMTLKVPASVKPSVSSVTISEAVSGLASKFGAYIQNHSKLKVVSAGAGSYSSTIKSYSVKILNKTYSGSTITSDVITSSGSVSVAVTVTDSRGRTATSTKNVTVTAYSKPSITAFTANRCDSDGTINDEGEYVKLAFAFSVTSLNSKNDKSYTLAYKLKDDADFTTLTSGSSYSLSTTYIPTIVFNGDNAYDFILTVTDYFNPVSHIADVPTAFTLMDYHSSGTGMAIGKVANKANTFEVALDTEFSGMVTGKVYGLSGLKSIPEGADLDTYLTPGVYGIQSNTRAGTLLNMPPEKVAGRVIVSIANGAIEDSANKYREQIYIPFDRAKGARRTWTRFLRSEQGAAWTADPWKSEALNVYPVGSIYLSYNHKDPAELFGGTWERISNAFLWATDASGTIGQTGGEKTHTLTTSELPSHSHGAVYSGNASGDKTLPWLSTGTLGTGDKLAYSTIATGGGAAHNNMPPYIQISVWRRTA